MNYNIIIFIIVYLFLKISSLNNPSSLGNDYPFSLKKGYNGAVIFMEYSMKIFEVSKTSDPFGPTYSVMSDSDIASYTCNSGEEKGGIYFKSYYYTSCFVSPNKFEILVYKPHDSGIISSTIFTFTRGSISFFKKSSTEELVGVAWLDGNYFNIYQIDQRVIKRQKRYSIGINIGKDIDCLYINKHQIIVCIFSYKDSNEQHSCQVNNFSGTEADFESNTKTLNSWVDHLSRKIRGNTDNNEDSDIFYYYYVGTNGITYIMPLRYRFPDTIEKVDSNYEYRYEVIKGCAPTHGSFDFAEDKFVGYNVFSCVEIHIQQK
jgi:hypothetical protein